MPNFTNNKKIIIAPLNWGLGHATRCIPIINALLKENFEPIIASDGDALKLLQKEFPELKNFELPSYSIQYTKKGENLKYRLLFDSPKILKAIKEEKKNIAKIIEEEDVSGIISDNRFGVRSKKIPSVYLTHQINVLSGSTTFFTTKFHQKIISKFDECWVPDYEDSANLAGDLSHFDKLNLNIKYIGPISRFTYRNVSKKYDLLVLLSGPEPQRSILEEKLLKELKSYNKKVLFIRGAISDKEKLSMRNKNIEIVNFMLQNELRLAINESEIILARSGYSTIMDLEKLNAKAFFIPTPGQFEQEYLAMYLKQKRIAPFSDQILFNIKMLNEINYFSGFSNKKTPNKVNFKSLFDVFV